MCVYLFIYLSMSDLNNSWQNKAYIIHRIKTRTQDLLYYCLLYSLETL